MSKKWILIFAILAVLIIFVILLIQCSPKESKTPTDSLLGAWAVNGRFLLPSADAILLVQINELAAAETENTYLGVGCMQTQGSTSWAPLSLQAVYDPAIETFGLNLLSTLVSEELETGAVVVRLAGEAKMNAAGIADDRASGSAYLNQAEVAWAAIHTSLEPKECAAADMNIIFQGEVGSQRDMAYLPPRDIANFSSETRVVAAEMRVELPDGQVLSAPYEASIFLPEVNFIDSFRFHTALEGAPLTDQAYRFTLLDVLGKQVPGAESEDFYRRCDQGAATNLRGVYSEKSYLELAWDAPELIPDYFDPDNEYGFYQVTLEQQAGSNQFYIYGAEAVSTLHRIPWNPILPGSAGVPDGHDYGISLSELEDGQYAIFVATYSYYEPEPGESGFECRVWDTRHALLVTKLEEKLTIRPAGAVSGFVHDAAGSPLVDIAVQIKGVRTGFTETVCSRANGYYLFTRLPLDSFVLSAGGIGADDCPQNSYATSSLPEIELSADAPILEGLDFSLGQ